MKNDASDSKNAAKSSVEALIDKAREYDWSEIDADDFEFEDGLTVICGNNIDTKQLLVKNWSDVSTMKQGLRPNDTSDDSRQGELYNTYMLMCMKKGKRMDVEYVSVSYMPDVERDTVDRFVSAELSDAAVNSKMREFVYHQISDTQSAYAQADEGGSRDSRGGVVTIVRDTNYHIANYVSQFGSNTGLTFPLLIYKKQIEYRAILEPNYLEDDDPYVLVAYVTIYPGISMTSFEAAEIASMDAAGLYNDEYSGIIAVKAVRTIFENEYPGLDYYAAMSPRMQSNDVSGSTLNMSFAVLLSISVSFDIDLNPASRIEMTTEYDADDRCTVTYEAFKKPLTIGSPCLPIDEFSYYQGVQFVSRGHYLYTSVATDIYYYFDAPSYGEDSGVWCGSARILEYLNE